MVAPTSEQETQDVFKLSVPYFNHCNGIALIYLWLGYSDSQAEGNMNS